MIIRTDKMDRILYRDQLDQNPGLPELEAAGTPKLTAWPEVVSDLWAGLFKAAPEMDEAASGPLAKAMQEVMETQEWKNLRSHTRLDELGSAIGTVTFGKDFLENLPPEVLDAEQKHHEAGAIEEAIAGLKERNGMSDEVKAKLDAHAAARRAEAQAALAAAEKATGGDIAQAVRIAGRRASEAAQADAIEAKVWASTWGDDAGTGGEIPLREQIAIARKLKANPAMQLLSKFLGRMKRLAQGAQARKIEKCPEEIVDVETGDDLKSVLPSELVFLKTQAAGLLFAKKYADRNLLQYKKTGTDRAGKGPVIVMIDESGSMGGDRIMWAKAIGLAMAWIAREQKRDIVLGGFAGLRTIWSKRFPGGMIPPKELEAFTAHFYAGGTDYALALTECMRLAGEDPTKKSDILFISDGECELHGTVRETVEQLKASLGCRIFSLCVGVDARSFESFSDAAFSISGNLDNDEPALERVFGI